MSIGKITVELELDTKNLSSGISSATSEFKKLETAGQQSGNNISKTLSSSFNNIGQKIAAQFKGIAGSLSGIGGTISKSFSGVGKAILAEFSGISGKVRQALNDVKSAVNSSFSGLGGDITNALRKVKGDVVREFSGLGGNIKSSLGNVREAITSAFSNITTPISTAFSNVNTIISTFINNVKSGLSGLKPAVDSVLKDAFSDAKSIINNAFSGTNLQSSLSQLSTVVKSTLGSLGSISKTALSTVKQSIISSFDGVAPGVASSLRSLDSQVSSSLNKVTQTVKTFQASIKAAMGGNGYSILPQDSDSKFTKFTNTITNSTSQAITKIRGMYQEISDGSSKASQSMQLIGAAITAHITTKIVEMAGAFANAFKEFDDTMRKVQAVTEAPADAFARLTGQAKLLGATTSFSAQDAGEAMVFLGQAGFNTSQIFAAMPATLNLARASMTELSDTADIMSNIMNGFRIPAEDTGRAADVLSKAANATNTDVQQLGMAMKYAAPLAHQMGWSLEETAAAAGLLSNAGIKRDMAGTVIRNAISRLIAPTDKAVGLLESYGLSVEDVNPKVKSLADILDTLTNAGMGTGQMITLFGLRAGPGMMALLNQGTDALRNMEQELLNSGGYAARAAEMMDAGWGGVVRRFEDMKEAIQLSFGSNLTAMVAPFVDAVSKIGVAFSQIPDWAQKGIIAFTAVATAGLALGAAIAGLTPLIGALELAFGAGAVLSFATGVGGAAVALGLIVAGLAAVEDEFHILSTSWQVLKDLFTVLGKSAEDLGNRLKDVASTNLGSSLSTSLSGLKNTILDFAKDAGQYLKDLIPTEWGSQVSKMVDDLKSRLSNALSQIKNFLQDNIKTLLLFPVSPAAQLDLVRLLLPDSWETKLNDAVSKIKNFVSNGLSGIWDSFKAALPEGWGASIEYEIAKVQQFFTEGFESIKTTVGNILKDILPSDWTSNFDYKIAEVRQLFENAGEDISDWLKDAFTPEGVDSLKQSVADLKDSILEQIDAIKEGFANMIPESLKSDLASLKDLLSDPLGNLHKSAENIRTTDELEDLGKENVQKSITQAHENLANSYATIDKATGESYASMVEKGNQYESETVSSNDAVIESNGQVAQSYGGIEEAQGKITTFKLENTDISSIEDPAKGKAVVTADALNKGMELADGSMLKYNADGQLVIQTLDGIQKRVYDIGNTKLTLASGEDVWVNTGNTNKMDAAGNKYFTKLSDQDYKEELYRQGIDETSTGKFNSKAPVGDRWAPDDTLITLNKDGKVDLPGGGIKYPSSFQQQNDRVLTATGAVKTNLSLKEANADSEGWDAGTKFARGFVQGIVTDKNKSAGKFVDDTKKIPTKDAITGKDIVPAGYTGKTILPSGQEIDYAKRLEMAGMEKPGVKEKEKTAVDRLVDAFNKIPFDLGKPGGIAHSSVYEPLKKILAPILGSGLGLLVGKGSAAPSNKLGPPSPGMPGASGVSTEQLPDASKVTELQTALDGLNNVTLSGITSQIGAFVTGLTGINFDTVRAQFDGFTAAISNLPSQITGALGGLSSSWSASFDSLKASASAKLAEISTELNTWATSGLASFGASLTTSIQSVLPAWNGSWDTLGTAAITKLTELGTSLSTWASGTLSSVLNTIVTSIQSILPTWDGSWGTLATAAITKLTELGTSLSTWATGTLSTILNSIVTSIQSILPTWDGSWSSLGTAAITRVTELGTSLLTWANSTLSSIINTIVTSVQSALPSWATSWDSIYNTAITKASEISTGLSNWVNSQLHSVLNSIITATQSLASEWASAWGTIISAALQKGAELISGLASLPDQISGLSGAFANAGNAITQGLLDAISNGFAAVYNEAVSWLNALSDLMPNSPAKKGPFHVLPDWDTAFYDPMHHSIKRARKLEGPYNRMLGRFKGSASFGKTDTEKGQSSRSRRSSQKRSSSRKSSSGFSDLTSKSNTATSSLNKNTSACKTNSAATKKLSSNLSSTASGCKSATNNLKTNTAASKSNIDAKNKLAKTSANNCKKTASACKASATAKSKAGKTSLTSGLKDQAAKLKTGTSALNTNTAACTKNTAAKTDLAKAGKKFAIAATLSGKPKEQSLSSFLESKAGAFQTRGANADTQKALEAITDSMESELGKIKVVADSGSKLGYKIVSDMGKGMTKGQKEAVDAANAAITAIDAELGTGGGSSTVKTDNSALKKNTANLKTNTAASSKNFAITGKLTKTSRAAGAKGIASKLKKDTAAIKTNTSACSKNLSVKSSLSKLGTKGAGLKTGSKLNAEASALKSDLNDLSDTDLSKIEKTTQGYLDKIKASGGKLKSVKTPGGELDANYLNNTKAAIQEIKKDRQEEATKGKNLKSLGAASGVKLNTAGGLKKGLGIKTSLKTGTTGTNEYKAQLEKLDDAALEKMKTTAKDVQKNAKSSGLKAETIKELDNIIKPIEEIQKERAAAQKQDNGLRDNLRKLDATELGNMKNLISSLEEQAKAGGIDLPSVKLAGGNYGVQDFGRISQVIQEIENERKGITGSAGGAKTRKKSGKGQPFNPDQKGGANAKNQKQTTGNLKIISDYDKPVDTSLGGIQHTTVADEIKKEIQKAKDNKAKTPQLKERSDWGVAKGPGILSTIWDKIKDFIGPSTGGKASAAPFKLGPPEAGMPGAKGADTALPEPSKIEEIRKSLESLNNISFDGIKEKLSKALSGLGDSLNLTGLKDTFTKALSGIGDSINVDGIRTKITNAFSNIELPSLDTLRTKITETFSRLGDSINVDGIRTKITTAFSNIELPSLDTIRAKVSEVFTGISTTIGTITDTLRTTLSTKWTEISTSITTALDTAKTNAATRIEELKTNFFTKIDEIKANLSTKLEEIKTNFTTKMEEIKADAATKWEEIKTTFFTKIDEIKTNLATRLEEIKTNFTTKMEEVRADAAAKWELIKTTFFTKIDEIKANLATRLEEIKTNFFTKLEEIRTNVDTKLEEVKNIFFTKLNEAKTIVTTALTDMVTIIQNKATEFYNAAVDIGQKVVDGIRSKIADAKQAASELLSAGATSAGSAANTVSTGVTNGINRLTTGAGTALNNGLQNLRDMGPNSPAKKGPFKTLPNWDTAFSIPMGKSLRKFGRMRGKFSQILAKFKMKKGFAPESVNSYFYKNESGNYVKSDTRQESVSTKTSSSTTSDSSGLSEAASASDEATSSFNSTATAGDNLSSSLNNTSTASTGTTNSLSGAATECGNTSTATQGLNSNLTATADTCQKVTDKLNTTATACKNVGTAIADTNAKANAATTGLDSTATANTATATACNANTASLNTNTTAATANTSACNANNTATQQLSTTTAANATSCNANTASLTANTTACTANSTANQQLATTQTAAATGCTAKAAACNTDTTNLATNTTSCQTNTTANQALAASHTASATACNTKSTACNTATTSLNTNTAACTANATANQQLATTNTATATACNATNTAATACTTGLTNTATACNTAATAATTTGTNFNNTATAAQTMNTEVQNSATTMNSLNFNTLISSLQAVITKMNEVVTAAQNMASQVAQYAAQAQASANSINAASASSGSGNGDTTNNYNIGEINNNGSSLGSNALNSALASNQ